MKKMIVGMASFDCVIFLKSRALARDPYRNDEL